MSSFCGGGEGWDSFVTSCEVLRLKRNGLLWAGLPCSSFTWINRFTSGRSKDHPIVAIIVGVCRCFQSVGAVLSRNNRWAPSCEAL